MKVNVQDCRAYSARALEIANLLDSNKSEDYLKVDEWLKANPSYAQYKIDTLVEVFDREVGLGADEPSPAGPGARRPRP